MFPENEYIHDDLTSNEYLKMLDEGITLDEIPRRLYDPLYKQGCSDDVMEELLTEEEYLNKMD